MTSNETSMLGDRRRSTTRGGMAAAAPATPAEPTAAPAAAPPERSATSAPPAQPAPAIPRAAPAPPPAVQHGDYVGAPSRAFGMKMLEPARTQLEAAVAALKDQGVPTDLTEVIHALIFTHAADPAEVHASLKKFRAARYGI